MATLEARPSQLADEAPPWSAGSYPLPSRDGKLCGHSDTLKTDFLCDPDLILSDKQADEVRAPLAHHLHTTDKNCAALVMLAAAFAWRQAQSSSRSRLHHL